MRRFEFVGPLVVAAAAVAVLLPLGLGTTVVALAVPWICIHALLAMSMRLVMQVGEINLAVGAFYGVGAYAAAQMNLIHVAPLGVSVAVGALAAATVALLFGLLILRATGAAFILVTFAACEVLRLVLTKWDWVGGNSGLVGVFAEPRTVITALVITTAIVALALLAMERSRWGLLFKLVENKPLLAACTGVSPRRIKLLALVVSAAISGLAGGFFAHYSSVVAPTDFTYMIAISVLAFVMIGGRHFLLGAVVGAAVLTYVSEELRAFGHYEPLVYGVALMVAMVVMPQGLVGTAAAAYQRFKGRLTAPASPIPILEPEPDKERVG